MVTRAKQKEWLQEAIAGAESDLSDANQRWNQLIADTGNAWEEVVRAQGSVDRLRKQDSAK